MEVAEEALLAGVEVDVYREGELEDHHFDVFTALHDDVKQGGNYRRVRSRVVISAREFPSTTKAAEMACTFAVTVHGGMAIACYLRL